MGSHSVTRYPTQVNTPCLNPSHAGWYSIYLPRRDERLSWPSWLDSAPAGSRTSDLSITTLTPNHCTTKTTDNISVLWVGFLKALYLIWIKKKKSGTEINAHVYYRQCGCTDLGGLNSCSLLYFSLSFSDTREGVMWKRTPGVTKAIAV